MSDRKAGRTQRIGVVPWNAKQPPKGALREQLRRVRMLRKAASEALLPIERPAALRVLDRRPTVAARIT